MPASYNESIKNIKYYRSICIVNNASLKHIMGDWNLLYGWIYNCTLLKDSQKRKKSLKGEKERKIAKDLHDIRAISSGHQNIQIENNIQIVCEIWRTINGKKAPGKKKGGKKDMISSLTGYINYF